MEYEQAEAILLHYLQTGSILDYEKWSDVHKDFDYDAYYESNEYHNGTRIFKKVNKEF
jgi:hypothetical protein